MKTPRPSNFAKQVLAACVGVVMATILTLALTGKFSGTSDGLSCAPCPHQDHPSQAVSLLSSKGEKASAKSATKPSTNSAMEPHPIMDDWEKEHGEIFPGRAFGTFKFYCTKIVDRLGLHMDFRRDIMIRMIDDYKSVTGIPESQIRGIEIGAQHSPWPAPDWVKMTYVDGAPTAELYKMHPEIAHLKFKEPDIVDRAEKLTKVPDETFDFMITSHLLEHTYDTLGAFEKKLLKIKVGGYLFMIIPNMCDTFDRGRLLTTWDHFLSEYNNPSVYLANDYEHYREGALSDIGQGDRAFSPLIGLEISGEHVNNFANRSMAKGYHIHYHTFTDQSLAEFLSRAAVELQFPFSLMAFVRYHGEIGVALVKTKSMLH